MDLQKLCTDARSLILETGNFIRNERKTFSSASIEMKGHNDLVSYVDKTAERKLVQGLSSLLPGCGFITEEKTVNITGEIYNWIIDPLDGTTNFIHGIPCFCISVALMEHEKIILGIIYEINLDECFYASQNGGAFLNGKAISVSKVAFVKDSLLATGFPYTDYKYMKQYMAIFDYCMHNTHGLRRLGSAAADLAYVACGRFEGFYEYGLKSWDLAAGVLIVTEAGGKVSDFKGGDNYIFGSELIACNSLIYNEFFEVVKNAFAQNS
jgi:myo-inositol-1(or 4)-monophosphatase